MFIGGSLRFGLRGIVTRDMSPCSSPTSAGVLAGDEVAAKAEMVELNTVLAGGQNNG